MESLQTMDAQSRESVMQALPYLIRVIKTRPIAGIKKFHEVPYSEPTTSMGSTRLARPDFFQDSARISLGDERSPVRVVPSSFLIET
jgi:hypothetical protein